MIVLRFFSLLFLGPSRVRGTDLYFTNYRVTGTSGTQLRTSGYQLREDDWFVFVTFFSSVKWLVSCYCVALSIQPIYALTYFIVLTFSQTNVFSIPSLLTRTTTISHSRYRCSLPWITGSDSWADYG